MMNRLIQTFTRRPALQGRATEPGSTRGPAAEARQSEPRAARIRSAHQRRCHEVRCAEADAEIRAAWAGAF